MCGVVMCICVSFRKALIYEYLGQAALKWQLCSALHQRRSKRSAFADVWPRLRCKIAARATQDRTRSHHSCLALSRSRHLGKARSTRSIGATHHPLTASRGRHWSFHGATMALRLIWVVASPVIGTPIHHRND